VQPKSWARLGLAVPVLITAVLVSPISPARPAPVSAQIGPCGDPAVRPWCDRTLGPDRRAGLLLAAMTLDEKIGLLAGDDLSGAAGQEGTHTGTSNGIARLGVPPVYFSDGPVGVRQGSSTGMPSSISVASSFDPHTAWDDAAVIGDEARRKGNDVVFAPTVNIMRTPLGGRTFEGFGEDPFLTAATAVGWIRGVQAQGVMGNIKHYALNNQEGIGVPVPGVLGAAAVGSRLTVDVHASERTMREIYLPAFEAAVAKAHVASVMCAYNRVNGQFGCENEHLLNDILKRDWRFKGFVLTDYGAAKNTIASLNNGLDLDIWPGVVYDPLLVQGALTTSQVSLDTIDGHVRRILRTMFAFGAFDRVHYPDIAETIDSNAHHRAAADVEARGIVLLKNQGGLLPLSAAGLSKVAVIGPEATTLKDGGGSSAITEFRTTTPLQALTARLGAGRVVYDDGSDAARAAEVARSADVAIVVVGDQMTEGMDKAEPTLDSGQQDGINRDALIAAVTAAQPRTVTILQTGSPVLTPWRAQAKALIEMWYPGQNGGTALTRVLFGEVDPGGRLPVTFPAAAADLPTAGDPEAYPGVAEVVKYKEGVLVGYRWYDAHRLPVAFPFGHGLSYTSFRYSGLQVERTSRQSAVVRFRVTNTGSRRGFAVPQLYVGMPRPAGVVQPPRQLKGFAKLSLAPGASRTVTLPLSRRSLAYWSDAAEGWRVEPGCYRLEIGKSSRNQVLTQRVGFGGGRCVRSVTVSPKEATPVAHVVAEKKLDQRLRELTIASPAMGGNVHARVLLPTGFTQHPDRTWPVLFLLHGCCDLGPEGYQAWSANSDVEKVTAGVNMIVVMPQGDFAGFYSDWLNHGAGGAPAYETFHLTELRRILERRYRAGQRRAIAGLSMGGFGALSYAARHPGMFRFAASYSGLVDSQSTTGPALISGLVTATQHDPTALWGDPVTDKAVWSAHNPMALAGRLVDLPTYISCGNGDPGPYETSPIPDPLEHELWQMNTAFVAKMRSLGAHLTAHLYGAESHTWPYWQREFHRSFPLIRKALGV
jgi:beta-glucosidase